MYLKGNKANRKKMHAKRCDFHFWYYMNSKHESVSAFCQLSSVNVLLAQLE